MTTPPTVGRYAGWHLEFHAEPKSERDPVASIGSSDYYASIDASLPAGLDGGSYTFVVEGITNQDYAALYRAMQPPSALLVHLHLYWKDSGVTGYLVDLAGLADTIHGDLPPNNTAVAILRVTALKRRAGTRRYEVVIEARERVYDLALRRIGADGRADDLKKAAEAIAGDDNVKIDLEFHGEVPTGEGGDPSEHERAWRRGEIALDRLQELANAIQHATRSYGLGVYLIRDGKLHAGPDRLSAGNLHELTSDTGLLQILWTGQEAEDPNFVPEGLDDREPQRDLFDLTLRGRPDIKPGDFVTFKRPPEETDEAGVPVSFSIDLNLPEEGPPVIMYVRGVSHRLAREEGFITVLRGVTVPSTVTPPLDVRKAWFQWSPPKGAAVPDARAVDDSAEAAAVGEFRKMAAKANGRRIEVGQVRGANVRDQKLPNQTEKLWRGLVADDGKPYAAAQLDFDEAASKFSSAPYASPVAWGKFGLVLPRYPGMRALIAHRNGDGDDLVDIGTLWKRGQAPESRPGDYWLGLPAELPEGEREQVADESQPNDPAGRATNDLIDADGNRVIEVGKLTVRVGTALLRDGGVRPDPEATDIHIEHQSGAKITIDQDGNVTIHAKKKLTLSAEDEITLDTPANVIVKTGGFMDVKDR
jgi:hypothetical protein